MLPANMAAMSFTIRNLIKQNVVNQSLRHISATSHLERSTRIVSQPLMDMNLHTNCMRANQRPMQYLQPMAQMSYDNTNKLHNKIHELITKSPKRVFVFMKGVPKSPQCGYSGMVVQIMEAYGVDFDSFDVLEDDQVRQEIKSYSDWPTIPQVYVDGQFVGGCDILLQMHQSDELKQLFEVEKKKE